MRWRKLVIALAVVAALVAVAAASGFYWLSTSGRAQREGSAPIPGLGGRVEVRFDRFGVPTVRAGSALDAAAALGWLHANDRMFQMEMIRRAATGRLAELFGDRALDYDRRIRRLGFPDATRRLLESASPQSRALLEAYARGVNAWLEERGDDLPPEFRLLRRRPEPWRPYDSVSVIFVMARMLSPVTSPTEDQNFRFLRAFGPDRARELVGDPDARIFDEIETLAKETPAPAEDVGRRAEGAGLGSNNWAVAPSRSADGHALLANDPHLGLGLPNVWYAATLEAPDDHATGMTLPGAPGVVLGRGERVAWAVTNLYVDDVDVFDEKLDPSGTKVLRGDHWEPIAVRQDTVRLDDGSSVAVEVRSTDRGPLLEADPEQGLPARSVAWTGWESGDQLAAFSALARAQSVDDVPAAIAGYSFPAQNLVAADADGHLLWTPLGRAPNRFGWDGHFPAPGWRTDVGWAGLVPATDNPVLRDPEQGLVATANSFLPVPQPAWFEGDFDTPFRADRIRELLAARHDWNVDSLAGIQTDVTSLWSRRLVALIGTGYSGAAGRAAGVLAAWDGTMAPTGPSALFSLVERELLRKIFEDEAVRAGLPRFGTRWRLLRLLEGEMSPSWFDDVSTPEVETREVTIGRALDAAWREGVARWGEDVSRWSWSSIHTLTLDHPLGSLPLLGSWFDRGPFPLPGSPTTVDALGGPWRGDAVDISYGPSMRFVTDAADPETTIDVLPGGESGHPADPHYADQLPLYLDGKYRQVPWSEPAIERTTVSRLTLVPAPD
jgi:penicillin amidase